METAIATTLFWLLAGWLLADFLTGVLHWLEDRFGAEDWPVLGRLVIAPNRLHHREPLAFTRTGFWSRNSTTMIATLAIGVPLLLLFGPSVMLVTAIIGGSLANQVHYWAHRPDRAPSIAQMAQSIGLLQARNQHSRHHRPPHHRGYCVLTGWLNPVLDGIGFWALIEKPIPERWFADHVG